VLKVVWLAKVCQSAGEFCQTGNCHGRWQNGSGWLAKFGKIVVHWLAEPNQLYSAYVIFSGIWVPFFLFSLKIHAVRSNILIVLFCMSWLVDLFTRLYRKISHKLTKRTTSQTVGYMTVISVTKTTPQVKTLSTETTSYLITL
jgi:hypothetical protein